jgi:cystathionine beta-synthase
MNESSPDRPDAGPLDSVLDTIGWTPLIRLNRVTTGIRTPVFIKMESFNPGGSVKDRIGLAMIDAAERDGLLGPGGTIVEGTSGNTGVGLAVVAAVRGYRCIFSIPDKMSDEKIRLLRAFGAEVVITPSDVTPDHPDYYVNVAKRIARETPGAYMANQHYNQENPEAHYLTTGPEIWEQTGGAVTHFVASPGTGGTISGTARFLKERNPQVRIVAGDPVGSIYAEYSRTGDKGADAPYLVEGIGNDKISSTLHFEWIDEFRTVTDLEAFSMARRLAREEGLLAGASTGLIVQVALDVARELDDPDSCVVTLLCDTGERYLSKVFDEDWLRDNGLSDVLETEAARRG